MSFIDRNIDSFHKGFKTRNGGCEDPTYLGFKFLFDFDPVAKDPETGMTMDSLFASPGTTLDSAEQYLTNIGYGSKASMMREFGVLLEDINSNSPWFFQTLDGVSDLWKLPIGEEFNNYRGKGKVLTITCLESIDMRITTLADLYRKATYEAKFMRQLVPENLRWFTLKLYVAEMRTFSQISQALTQTNISLGGIGGAIGNAVGGAVGNVIKEVGYSLSANNYQDRFQTIDNLISTICFDLDHCTFDFSDSFPVDGAINMAGDLVMSTQRIKINVGRINEVNQYTLQDLLLADSAGPLVDHSLINYTADSGANTSSEDDSNFLGKLNSEPDAQMNPRSRTSNNNTGGLGNVYGLANLIGLINSFVGPKHQQPLGNAENPDPSTNGRNTSPKNLGNAEKP